MTGSGTQADPFIIQNLTDLQNMQDNEEAFYELEGDIDASASSGFTDGSRSGFVPIGAINDQFTGELDGKGFTISDIFQDRTNDLAGLFYLPNAVIKNVKMTDVDIDGGNGIGALIGRMAGGTITNCSSTGSIIVGSDQMGGLIGRMDDGTVSNCWSSCTVTSAGGQDSIGGLIGNMQGGTVFQCYATGAVTGDGDQTGGFAGLLIGNIDDCYAMGAVSGANITGGFTGYAFSGTIDNCYSTGSVSGTTNTGGFNGLGGATVSDCFWDTETSGEATSDGGTGQITAEMLVESNYTDAGWDFTDIWGIEGGQNDGYPYLQGDKVLVGEESGTLRVYRDRLRYNDAFGVTRDLHGVDVTSDPEILAWL